MAHELGLTQKTIWLKFQPLFLHPPGPAMVWEVVPPNFTLSSKPWVYSVDGKWHRRKGVTLIHKDATNHEVIWWSKAKSESYQALFTDLDKLSTQIIEVFHSSLPVGAVSDWKGSMVSTIALFFHELPHQRCLFHVKKDIKNLLPKYSPLMATQELRKIGMNITKVNTHLDKEVWITWLHTWEAVYGDLLTEKSYQEPDVFNPNKRRRWWYTHKNLRRAYRILSVDQENLFIHIDYPLVPTTNNAVEGLNADIKGKLHEHRGIPYDYQYAFIAWLLTFRRIKTNQQLKQLWVKWKRL